MKVIHTAFFSGDFAAAVFYKVMFLPIQTKMTTLFMNNILYYNYNQNITAEYKFDLQDSLNNSVMVI